MKKVKLAKLDVVIPEKQTMGLNTLQIGKSVKSMTLDGDWLRVETATKKVQVHISRIEYLELYEQEAKKETNLGQGESRPAGDAKKAAKASSPGRGSSPVRTTKKVRKKPKKASSSVLQSSSGEDLRPSVPAPVGSDEVPS